MIERVHHRAWFPVVAVPARNEVERLPRLLGALSGQSWFTLKRGRLRVVVVLNNCTDDSRGAVAYAAARYPNLDLDVKAIDFPLAMAHVGSARRLALDKALELAPSLCRSVLMTTDADAVPEPTWIEANLRAIDAGADLVGGLIIGDETEEMQHGPGFLRRAALQLRYARRLDQLASVLDPLFYDPWPRHGDHTGASLAIRGNVYAAVGGLPALPSREDLALVSRVRAAGFRLRHSLGVRVRVSARLDGRAPGGMADCLKRWIWADATGQPQLVAEPENGRLPLSNETHVARTLLG